VHFQPLEMEVKAVSAYLKGRVLNAGCGARDLTDLLKSFGATEVVNYDIVSPIPGAIIGSLTNTPFADGEFDSIFCNAVLEHVPEIDKVMSELARTLKRGGYLISGVPFLQPYHLNPTDYRRYTRDGLKEIGERHGLKTVDILPVHTIAQTLGWIAWEWALEKRGWRPSVVYPLVWLATRLSYKSDLMVKNNANTFQIVYLKACQ
jgi:SAM-dependent methyltransferase